MSRIDPLLDRQITNAGFTTDASPTPEQLGDLFERVSLTYARSSDQRDKLTKALELSKQASRGILGERDRLTELVVGLGDALFEMSRPSTQPYDQIRHKWTTYLTEVLDSDELLDGDPAVVRGAHAVNRGFVAMGDALEEAHHHIATDRDLQRELAGANALVMPDQDGYELGFLATAGFCEPMGACGGDVWTVRRLDDGRVLVMVGDATGHGVRSAIVAAAARTATSLFCPPGGPPGQGLADLCEQANRAIHDIGRGHLMLTWVAALYDPARRELEIANAGHRLPLMVRDGELHPVVARGSPLGSADHADCAPITLPVRHGDLLVLYSDGLVETEGPSGDRFSERRLRAAIAAHHDPDPRVMRDGMLGELRSFRGLRPRTDDLTLVLARVRAPDSEDAWSSTP